LNSSQDLTPNDMLARASLVFVRAIMGIALMNYWIAPQDASARTGYPYFSHAHPGRALSL
jgi:hypothetical protein